MIRHPTYLFHKALAESIVDLDRRYHFLNLKPLPKKFPNKSNGRLILDNEVKNRIYTQRGGQVIYTS